MRITNLDSNVAEAIGHAFGYYDYGNEVGMGAFYRSKDAVAAYIAGYVRMAFEGNMLYTTSAQGEGYIAYKLPGQKLKLRAGFQLIKALFQSMNLKELLCMGTAVSKGGSSLQDRMKKEKKPYIFVGLVCVPEQFQGQGYMRKVMELAYAEGNRLQVPVLLETDAKSKCDKYMHLGMQLEGVRDLGNYGKLYDLIKYPDQVDQLSIIYQTPLQEIDGVVATIMGLDRAIRCENNTGASVYDDRGILFL